MIDSSIGCGGSSSNGGAHPIHGTSRGRGRFGSFFASAVENHANPEVVARYAAALDAPRGKSFVWFEDSAHMPYYEEPVRFREALLGVLLSPAPGLI